MHLCTHTCTLYLTRPGGKDAHCYVHATLLKTQLCLNYAQISSTCKFANRHVGVYEIGLFILGYCEGERGSALLLLLSGALDCLSQLVRTWICRR